MCFSSGAIRENNLIEPFMFSRELEPGLERWPCSDQNYRLESQTSPSLHCPSHKPKIQSAEYGSCPCCVPSVTTVFLPLGESGGERGTDQMGQEGSEAGNTHPPRRALPAGTQLGFPQLEDLSTLQARLTLWLTLIRMLWTSMCVAEVVRWVILCKISLQWSLEGKSNAGSAATEAASLHI